MAGGGWNRSVRPSAERDTAAAATVGCLPFLFLLLLDATVVLCMRGDDLGDSSGRHGPFMEVSFRRENALVR
jgi:hypothetical protein